VYGVVCGELIVLNTPELRQHMAHMNDSLALLREDRELLNRDVLVEREANKKLTEENDQVRRAALPSV
jgi:hypothetical protein